DLAAWFHVPDPHWGNPALAGLLQFLQCPDGRLFYRVYGKNGLQGQARAIDPHDREQSYPCWDVMGFRFRVTDYLDRAVEERRLVPHDVPPGGERRDLVPALRGTLRHEGRSAEFCVRLGERTPEKVQAGGDWFLVRYGKA